jgi:arylsulfatase A-like enzyme
MTKVSDPAAILRRLWKVALSISTALAVLPPVQGAQAVEPERPNVLIVVTDDQPLGMMGGAMPKTTEWLSTGTRYANAVASTPLCCPARATILSGRYVHNHDVRNLSEAYRFDFGMSLPRTMQDNGYTTAIAGKYFNEWNLHADNPPHFDRFSVFAGGYESDVRSDPQTQAAVSGEPGQVFYSQDTTATTQQAGLSMLRDFEADDTKPWMLYLAPYAPHGPQRGEVRPGYGDAPSLDAEYERDLSDKPPHVRDVTRGQHVSGIRQGEHRAMYRALRVVDDMMADVRAQLEASGELDNTLVLFTSDNGYLLGQHGLVGKKEPYEESLRVPMYAWLPGVIPSDVDRRIAGLVDIAPTVYDVAGIAPDYPVDGQSLLGPATRQRILIEHFGGGAGHQNVGDWSGWWRPGSMYRRNSYSSLGTAGCDDGRRTICQRYRNAPGHEEAYRGTEQTHNLLQGGARAVAHRRWTAAASQCVGVRCHELEAKPGLRVKPRSLIRVTYRGPRWFRSGETRTVRVVARNVSGRRLPVMRLRVEQNPQWTVRPLRRPRFAGVAPGETVAVRWRLRFTGTGPVSLSVWAGARGALAWDAAPVRVG